MRKIVCQDGWTLVELLIAFSIIAILLTVGLPSYSAAARSNCVVTAANTMLSVLTAARSEALKRDRDVALCKSSDGEQCLADAGIDWDRGYLMYLDANANHRRETDETLLKVELPLSTCAAIRGGSGGYGSELSYDGFGKASPLGHFMVIARSDSHYARRVVVSPSGRPRICDPALKPGSSGTTCPP